MGAPRFERDRELIPSPVVIGWLLEAGGRLRT
jgi:hypothetical protein